MISRLFLSSISTAILCVSAAASNQYFIVARYDPSIIQGFDGKYWGRESDKAFLSGDDSQLQWLAKLDIRYDAIVFDSENSSLYLCYLDRGEVKMDESNILYRAENYLVSISAPGSNVRYRFLKHRIFPTESLSGQPEMILTYDPLVDEMIGQVSQSGIYDFLGRISGAFPIDFDGQQDTIHTRYSGTEDNLLAARYLRQTFEDYGYQSELHGFYGGTIRHLASSGDNLAWLVTENSEALRTTDGGNWLIMPDGTNNSLWGIANWGSDSVWLTGDLGTIRFSTNGGQSFVSQNSGSNAFLFGASFISSTDGWIAGDYGRVLHTTNGGQNWSTQQTPVGSRLYDVCFIDSQNGWACGRDGAIVHTSDGGSSWAPQNSNTAQRLYGIDFIDPQNGWVVGWAGVVRHTTDGGANWQTVSLGTGTEKYHVEFVDSSFGSIVGWNGEIFITTDGGANWEQRSPGTNADFYGVTFADNQIGFAGGNGILVRTTDGGATWFSQTGNIESSWKNVVATKTGTTDPQEQVIICAHMDDRSEQPETYAPGADDNGSGTIAVVEAARIFAEYNFEKTIKFCLWTGEEQGLLGSEAYAAEAFARGDNIIGVFNLDMISWDGNRDGSSEFHTGTSDPSIALGNAMVEVVNDYSLSLAPDIITWGATGASDHASFWEYGYAAMLGIEDYSSDFNPYYHSTGDNLDHIMERFFTEFTKAAVGVTATLAVPDTVNTAVSENNALPSGIALSANYPNPFNAATTISFATPKETEIDLAVYDILGRRVTTLFSGSVNAGIHRVTWNAGNQSSGVYFYRLTAGDNTATSRMTLLK